MYISVDRFRPLPAKAGRHGRIFTVLILCLCLLPGHLHALDPEFGRIVPDLRGKTVEQATATLDSLGLGINISGHLPSPSPTGTVVRQSPQRGAETTVGVKVSVWLSRQSLSISPVEPLRPPVTELPPSREPQPRPSLESPNAVIRPLTLEVLQGEPAIFESLSTPRGSIAESWSGPGSQQGSGNGFEVSTVGLEPGRYYVDLVVTDNRERRSRARAVLVVTARRDSLPPPGGGSDGGPGEPPPRQRTVLIGCDPAQVRQQMPVACTAESAPVSGEALYRFHFGDGTIHDTPSASATHSYETAGTFEAYVELLGEHGAVVAESNRAVIEVFETSPHPPPPPPNRRMWLWLGSALLGGIGAGCFLLARRRAVPDKGGGPVPDFRAVPRSDRGTQELTGATSQMVDSEICFVPISDNGTQDLDERAEPFVIEERWENE